MKTSPVRPVATALLLLTTLAGLAGAEPVAVRPEANPSLEVNLIAFGSCARQTEPQPVWRAIRHARPDLFLMIGDNVYADWGSRQETRAAYDALAAQPGFRDLRAQCPILAIWDDHDYGVNDGGASFPHKKATKAEFLRFFDPPPDSPLRQREGLYDAHLFGPPDRRVQVILLDTRSFRSDLVARPRSEHARLGRYRPDDSPHATVLGDEQWQWLAQQLTVPARLRLLVSSIQVIPDEHRFERWALMPRERRRLFDLLAHSGADGVVLLSGDRHLAEISQLRPGANNPLRYPLYEVTSSGLNQRDEGIVQEPNRHRISTTSLRRANYGSVAVQWEDDDPLITLATHRVDGRALMAESFPLSFLSARRRADP